MSQKYDYLQNVKMYTNNVINTNDINYAKQNEIATCEKIEVREQEQQKFISLIMSGDTPINGMVLWHGLGSGKTLTSILTTRENNRNVVVFAPASLIGNYKREIDFAMNNNLLQKPNIEDYKTYFTKHGINCGFTEDLKKYNAKNVASTRKILKSYNQKNVASTRKITKKRHQKNTTARIAKSLQRTIKKWGGTNDYSNNEKEAASGLLSLFSSPRPPPPAPQNKDDKRAYISGIKTITALRQPPMPLPKPPQELINLSSDDVLLNINQTCNKQSIGKNNIKYPKNKKYVLDGKPNINTYYFYSSNGDLNNNNLSDYKYYFRENSFIVFDESQLFISKLYNSYKSKSGSFYYFYKRFIQYFHKNNLRALFLSGTPIVNNPAELGILFNMLKGDEHLFDVDDFNKIYELENKPPPYKYNFTNTERETQLHHLLEVSTVKNAEKFKQKTYGLLSYFGNIQSLLPQVSLSNDETGNLKYGYNNDGKPLFLIKECTMTKAQYTRVRLLDILIDLLSTKTDNSIKAENEYLINFKTISYDVAFMPNLNIKYEGDDYNIMQLLYNLIHDNPNVTTKEILYGNDEKYKIIKNMLNEIKTKLNLPKKNEFLYSVRNRKEGVSNFYRDYFIKLEELINAPEAQEFKDDKTNGDVLHDYSCKIYEICQTIKQNLKKKHIIYCESRRVNVILARALRAYCNMIEYMGNDVVSSENMYMFLTGVGEDNPEDDIFKYYNNEGKLRVNPVKKEEMIDYFNNQDKIKVVILNSAAAEGITLKQVNFVHLLQVPPNMSRLYQIIGRAIRNCTHKNAVDKTVKPILYFAVPPVGVISFKNRNIEAYEDIVNKNDTFLPYLKLLKNSSIDCSLTQKIKGNEQLKCFEDEIQDG